MEREQTTTTEAVAEALYTCGHRQHYDFPYRMRDEVTKERVRERAREVIALIVAEEHARLRELFDEIPTDQEIDGFPYERSAGEAMRDVLALLEAGE